MTKYSKGGRCNTCETEHEETFRGYCPPCRQDYDRAWYHTNKAKIAAARQIKRKARRLKLYEKLWKYHETHPCITCGESDPVVLEFDHIDRKTKKSSISNMLSDICTWERISAEIKKCRVLCSNCHKRHTAVQMGYYQ